MFPLDVSTVALIIVILYLLSSIKILAEYERELRKGAAPRPTGTDLEA